MNNPAHKRKFIGSILLGLLTISFVITLSPILSGPSPNATPTIIDPEIQPLLANPNCNPIRVILEFRRDYSLSQISQLLTSIDISSQVESGFLRPRTVVSSISVHTLRVLLDNQVLHSVSLVI